MFCKCSALHITEEETNPLSVYQKDWCLALVNLESKESKTIAPRTPQQNVASQQLRGLDKGESYNTKSHAEAQQMDLAIANLLAKGAVREVQSQEDQFTSTLFLVQKENGEFRPVIISSGAKSIPRKGVLQNERTTGCNLHRRYAATSSTEPGVANTVCAVVAFLENLGFQVKMEKCSVAPSQCIVFLGAQLYSTTVRLSLPQLKLKLLASFLFPLTKLFQGSLFLDGYQRPYGWPELY